MVTLSQVRGLFGENMEFVFEFNDNGTLYICQNAPDGWEKQSVQVTRNRKRYGVATAFTQSLLFVKNEIDYLKSYIENNGYEGNLKLTIYELNALTMTYDVFFVGKVELKGYEIKDSKMKVSLIDSKISNIIDLNGDKDFSIKADDYAPFLKDVIFGGIPLVEQADQSGSAPAIGGLVIPSRVVTNHNPDAYVCLPIVSANIDANISEFYDVDYELIEFKGNPTQAVNSYFTAGKNGTCVVPYNISLMFSVDDNPNISEDYMMGRFTLALCDGRGDNPIGAIFYSILGAFDIGPLSWFYDQFSFKWVLSRSVQGTATFNISEGADVFLMLLMYREQTDQGSPDIRTDSMILGFSVEMKTVFTETYASKTIKGLPIDDLTKLSLKQISNGEFDTINGISDYHKIIITTGNLMRQNITSSINCKFNDLTDILIKKLGQGFSVIDDEITFDENHNFFDLTDVLINLGNVSEFVERGMVDYLYSHARTGDRPYDTEYLSGKKSLHEETMFKTPVESVNNTLDLVTEITANPFEIEDVFRTATGTDSETDYESDGKLYLIWCKIVDNVWVIDRDNYDIEESSSYPTLDFPYPTTIYNLQFSPARILQRNLFNVHQSIIDDESVIKCEKRTKYEDYFSKLTTESNTIYEGRGFKISPRCGTTTDPFLIDDNQKLTPVAYEFTSPLNGLTIPTIVSNIKKLVLFQYNGTKYAGFIDDIGRNPATEEAQNVKLIKANLTTEQIEALWQI